MILHGILNVNKLSDINYTSNEDIKDSIYLDFKEKITVNPTLKIDGNSPLTIESNLTTTGGSIKIDKTISNEKQFDCACNRTVFLFSK